MAIKTYVFILAIVAAGGRAQLTSFLFSGLANTARGLTESFYSQPTVQRASERTGNLLADIFNVFSSVPIAAARSRGRSQANFPSFVNVNNIETPDLVPDISAGSTNEDANMSVGDLIVKYGYPMEKHKVITEDGYILTMYRIPGNGPVVFLMHGLLGSADDYVIAGPDSGLAYLLSQEGYDVWLGNARGNKHCREHIEYKTKDSIFWDFSWHEIGYHDLPAMIDYVLNTTEQATLKYIGHSQGTTTFFVMASERPEYNEKISLMVALSPVAFMSHAKSPLVRFLSAPAPLIYELFKAAGIHELLPDNSMMRSFKKMMCGPGHSAKMFCSNVLFMIVGYGYDQLNVTNLPVIYGHVPSGAAGKQLVHYGQGFLSGDFKMYDYGSNYENKQKYGSSEPTHYNLSNVVAPVALFYSDADWMSHPTDVDELYNKLANPIDIYKIPHKSFNHLDFIWAKDFRKIIYARLKRLLSYF